MWVRALAILLFASQVLFAPLDAQEVVGSCRYEKTSAAVLTCLQPGGKWSPPSASCCKALLYAIDQLPGSGEKGACCLCRYMRAKDTSPGLVMSYSMCQGKDRHIVNRWTFPIKPCYRVCQGNKKPSSTQKDRPVVHAHGASNTIFIVMWAVAAVALCVVLLVCCWYLWWVKAAANSPKSSESTRGSFLEGGEQRRSSSGRHDSAQLKLRRASTSRSSPNSGGGRNHGSELLVFELKDVQKASLLLCFRES